MLTWVSIEYRLMRGRLRVQHLIVSEGSQESATVLAIIQWLLFRIILEAGTRDRHVFVRHVNFIWLLMHSGFQEHKRGISSLEGG